jgi:hypothetical protein
VAPQRRDTPDRPPQAGHNQLTWPRSGATRRTARRRQATTRGQKMTRRRMVSGIARIWSTMACVVPLALSVTT